MESKILLEPRYAVTDVQALTSFTPEQREVILQDSNAFEVFGLTAFSQMAEIFHTFDIDTKSLPPELFVSFPNKYQSIGRKVISQFDLIHKKMVSSFSLEWLIFTMEDEQQIRFSLANHQGKLDILFQFHSFPERETIFNNIDEMFLSGETAHCYFQDIVDAFPNQIVYLRYSTNVGTSLYYHQEELQNVHFIGSPMYFRLDVTDSYVCCDDTQFFDTVPVFEDYGNWIPANILLEEYLENSILRSPLDLVVILNKMGFTAPFYLETDTGHLTVVDANEHEMQISFFKNFMFIQLEGDDFAYEYSISTAGVSLDITLENPHIVYLF